MTTVKRATLVKLPSYPWWYHWAQLGASAGIGISVAGTVAPFVPIPFLAPIVGVVAAVGNVVTCYAQSGIKKAKKQ
jgi:hypothetical protein